MSASKLEAAAIEGGFLHRYYDIKAAGRSAEQAFYAAWFATPRDKRIPRNAAEVAALFGFSSVRVFSTWRSRAWWRELAIEKLRERVFEEYLAEVDEKTIQAAISEQGPAGVAARKLFYEQLRLAKPPAQTNLNLDLSQLTNEQLERIAAGDDPAGVLVTNQGGG